MSNRQGLTDAQVLAALYNASGPNLPGALGLLAAATRKEMSVDEAQALLDKHVGQGRVGVGPAAYFDYIGPRVMKIDVSGDPLDFRLYDRDNGQGAGERAIFAMLDTLTRPAR